MEEVDKNSIEKTRQYHKEYRKKNKERLKYQDHIQRQTWRRELMEEIGGAFCKDCGNNDFRVLEFDHVFGEKTKNVSAFLAKNWAKALEEAKKCEVVCANCHKIRTDERAIKPDYKETSWVKLSKTHCPKGHEKSPENIYFHNRKKYCRLCKKEDYIRRRDDNVGS